MTAQISFNELHNLPHLLLRNAKYKISSLYKKQHSTKINEDLNRKASANHRGVYSSSLLAVRSSNLLSSSLFSQQMQKRFYGKVKKAAKARDKKVELTIKIPRCAPKKPKLRLPICPPIIKTTGSGPPRLQLEGCDDACVFPRKFCCVRPDRTIDTSGRIRTPYPSFLECLRNAIDIQKPIECSCWDNVQSPCEADARMRFVRPATRFCK